MNRWRHLFSKISQLDEIGTRRNNQWTHEEHFDTHALHEIHTNCEPSLIIQFFLVRSEIHRNYSRDIYNADWSTKVDAYDRYVSVVDRFHTEIEQNKGSCEQLRKTLNSYLQ